MYLTHSLIHSHILFLSFSLSLIIPILTLFHFAALAVLRKLRQGPSVKLRLDCGFLGNSLDFYVHSPNPSHRGIRFLVLDVYSTRVSLPRRYRQAPPSRSSLPFFLFIYFSASCLRSRKQRRDLMLCGSDVFRASRNTTRINRAPICRYAWSTCVYTRATLIFRK